jgi:HPt (histidine-containing phosphotransfer) domain-containing protein
MDDYLSKPVNSKELSEMVQRWAGKKVLRSPTEAVVPVAAIRKEAPVDLTSLRELTGGDNDFEREIIDLFLDDTVLRLDRIKEAIEGGNSIGVEAEAHSIKGVSGNMGAERFRKLAQTLEFKGKSEGSLEGAEQMLADLRSEFENVKRFFQENR